MNLRSFVMDKEKDKLVLNINKTKHIQTNIKKTTEGTYLYSVMKTNTCINHSINRFVITITILNFLYYNAIDEKYTLA